MNILRNRLLSVIVLTMLSLVVTFLAVDPAYGKTQVVRFEFHDVFSDTGGNECLPPDLIGTVTGTVTVTGQELETNAGFHLRSTDHLDYRIDFPDGSYALGAAVEHEAWNVNFQTSRGIDTLTIHEPRTLYAADGQPIGQVMIHFLLHLAYIDSNGNVWPDPDEITASIERFRFTCH